MTTTRDEKNRSWPSLFRHFAPCYPCPPPSTPRDSTRRSSGSQTTAATKKCTRNRAERSALGGGAVGAASSLLASFTHHARNSPLVAIQNNRRQHASPSLRARRAGRREQKALKGWRPRPREISCLIAGPSRLSLFLSFLLSQTKPHPSLRNLLEPSDGRPGSHRGRRVGRRRRRR